MMKLLIVEDDLSLLTGLSFAIRKQGYELDIAKTCLEAEKMWENGTYDLVILDVSLPDGTGFALCKKIRECSKAPILFLTADDEEADIIMGLELGGDDYITKPFKLAVLLSKIGALLRRSNGFSETGNVLCSNGITLDLLGGKAYRGNTELDLTAGEYKLLRLFMEHKNMILSGETILARLWDCNEKFVDTNTLTVYIRRLRTKIETNPSKPEKILTVRGMGYRWSCET